MEREVTVKVNYVLGNQSAFAEAGKRADDVNKKVNEVGGSFLSKFQSVLTTGMQGGGISGMLGAAGIGAGAMGTFGAGYGIASGLAGTLHGSGMRGQGILGFIDDWMAPLSGRGAREAKQDIKIGQSGHFASVTGERLQAQREMQDLRRSTLFAPSTSVDPFQRQREERQMLANQMMSLQGDKSRTEREYQQNRGAMVALNAQAIGAGERDTNNMNIRKLDAEYFKNTAKFKQEELARATELNALDKSVYEQKKSMTRGSQLQFASMNLGEQQSLMMAAETLKAGKTLMPEQAAMLRSSPMFAEKMQAYDMQYAERSGFGQLRKLAGAETTEEDAKMQFEATMNLKKKLTAVLAQVISDINFNDRQVKDAMNLIQAQRTALGPNK